VNYETFLFDNMSQMLAFAVILAIVGVFIPYIVYKIFEFRKNSKGTISGKILWFIILMVLLVFALLMFYLVGWNMLQKLVTGYGG
jgi:hypothetical protein